MDTSIQITQEGETERITIVGPINEEAEIHLSKVVENVGKNCIINFAQVTFINSLGVRAWINFIRELGNGRKIVFEECTPEIVNQINMIPNFKGNAEIKSVYGTYYCDECGHQQNYLFENGKTLPQSEDINLPDIKCEKCGADMEFEEVEDAFFSFAIAS